jgi:GTP-binding protein
MSTARPLVAIIGRPNVGKSTLFNRLLGERRAIVAREPRLTRDRLYGTLDWAGREIALVDTAGLDSLSQGEMVENTLRGTVQAIEEADVIVFLVDVREGLTALDLEVAERLRRARVPVVLGANKTESPSDQGFLHELYTLGMGEALRLSALHGTNTGDLLDHIVSVLPTPVPAPEDEGGEVAVCIVGRPNVGKSSLLNAILGQERSVVSSLPGTTRDPVDTVLETETDGVRQRVRLIDTAGIRRHGLTKGPVEHYSLLRAFRALERSDVAVLVIDAAEGVRAQDQHIAGYAAEAGKGVVLVINKWDLLGAEERDDKAWHRLIAREFKFLPDVPVLYVSATRARRVADVLPAALGVGAARLRRITTPELNRVMREAFASHPPAARKGRQLRLLYATQGKERTPTIVLFVNDPELAHFSFRRYLENQLRETYDFRGVPLRVLFRRRSRDQARDGPVRRAAAANHR